MSSFSVESLLNDAIKLSMNLKECEEESDGLIYQSVNIKKDNENIKEYTEEMNILSNTSVKQPRKSLIASIQCESKKMKQLEAENIELKSTLQDYELVMKLMSQKYRNHISKLISHMHAETNLNVNNAINSKYKQKIDEQTVKIEQLTAFIQKIMSLDIQNFLDIQKSLTRLELENEGLRLMLGIAKENDNLKPTERSTSDIGVQTEIVENSVNNVNDQSFNDTMRKMGNLNISIDMDISAVDLNNTNSTKKSVNEMNHKFEMNNSATIKKNLIKDDSLKLNSNK